MIRCVQTSNFYCAFHDCLGLMENFLVIHQLRCNGVLEGWRVSESVERDSPAETSMVTSSRGTLLHKFILLEIYAD